MTSDSTDLVNIADSSKIIPTFDASTLPVSGYTTADFPENHWGYKQDSGNFKDFKSTQIVLQNNGRTNEDTTSLTFGAKIDFLQPSGTYENTLVFTTTATPPIYIQDVDSSMCSTTETSIVTDIRDGEKYGIRKLPDGNCWMVKNLDLAGGTTLTSADSNVMADYTLPNSDTAGFDNNTGDYVYNSHRTTCGENMPCYSYYSYAAATAGTNPSSSKASSDICPRGWRMPTNAEYTTLIGIYTTETALLSPPFNGVYAGLFRDGQFSNGGMYGMYWSSDIYNTDSAYFLSFRSDSHVAVDRNVKRVGRTIRCIAKK